MLTLALALGRLSSPALAVARLKAPRLLAALLCSLVLCTSCATRNPFAIGGGVELGRLRIGTAEFSLKRVHAPYGREFVAVCRQEDGDKLRSALRGKAVLKRDGVPVTELTFSPDTVLECSSWFKEKRRLAGYLLDRSRRWPRKAVFRAEGRYTVELTLWSQPPEGSTLWMGYLRWYD